MHACCFGVFTVENELCCANAMTRFRSKSIKSVIEEVISLCIVFV